MKNFNLSILFIVFCFFGVNAQDQQVANSNFENWTDEHYAVDWNSFEFGSYPLIYYTADRTTDAAFGTYAVKLETQDALGNKIPGIIMLGDLNMDTFMPEGGVPFTDRPTGFSFSYKYSPVNGDALFIFALLTKWNEDTQETDTIGGGLLQSSDVQDPYILKTVPIYYQSIEEPDTINVGFVSSSNPPQAGSTLYIDSLAMVYELVNYPTVCFPEVDVTPTSFTALWGAIPYASAYELEVAYDEDFTNYVTDFPMTIVNTGYNSAYNVSGLETDQYFYRVKTIYGTEDGGYSNVESVPLPTLALEGDVLGHISFTANWSEVASATDYLLDVATDEAFVNMVDGYSELSVGTVTSIIVDGLEAGTTYNYRLKAVYDGDTSIASNVISLTTEPSSVENYDNTQFIVSSYRNVINILVKNYSNPILVEVFDISGRKLISKNFYSKNITLGMPHSGFYIVKITDGNFGTTKKVILY